MNTKTREEIVSECAIAVASCWGHYSNTPLNADDRNKIKRKLNLLLPPEVEITQWQACADAYDKEMSEQEEEAV